MCTSDSPLDVKTARPAAKNLHHHELARHKKPAEGRVCMHPAHQPLGAGAGINGPQVILLDLRRVSDWKPPWIPTGIHWLGCWHKNTPSNLNKCFFLFHQVKLLLSPTCNNFAKCVTPPGLEVGFLPLQDQQDRLFQVVAPPQQQASLHRRRPSTQGWI